MDAQPRPRGKHHLMAEVWSWLKFSLQERTKGRSNLSPLSFRQLNREQQDYVTDSSSTFEEDMPKDISERTD